MNDPNTTQLASQCMIKKVQQHLLCGFDIHMMQIDSVSGAEVAPSETSEDSFLVSGSQEEQFLPGLKLD